MLEIALYLSHFEQICFYEVQGLIYYILLYITNLLYIFIIFIFYLFIFLEVQGLIYEVRH